MRNLVWVLLLGCAVLLPGCGSGGKKADSGRPKVAFITNQVADFWKIAGAGCEAASKDFDIDVEFKMPVVAEAGEQKRIITDLLNTGIKGIAISPIDADNQVEDLNSWGKKVPLITHDSDAPNSDRLMYVGMDNYAAGREVGKLVKKALPDGGAVIIFIGRLEQDNSKKRRQGVIDELLDRSEDPTRFDSPDSMIEGKWSILATLLDQGKAEDCKAKAADAINKYPKLAGMVGLFEYNPPACLQALQQADKLGKIKVIGFDENKVTLEAIEKGNCIGTVVQDPYQYGYKSIEILSGLLKGKKDVIPESKFIAIPARVITKENVVEFRDDLKAKIGG